MLVTRKEGFIVNYASEVTAWALMNLSARQSHLMNQTWPLIRSQRLNNKAAGFTSNNKLGYFLNPLHVCDAEAVHARCANARTHRIRGKTFNSNLSSCCLSCFLCLMEPEAHCS